MAPPPIAGSVIMTPTTVLGNRVNPFVASARETLLSGTRRIAVRLLICEYVPVTLSTFNSWSLQQKIAQLRGQVVIATFVEGSLAVEAIKAWIDDLVGLAHP